MMETESSELEADVEFLKTSIFRNRKLLFWVLSLFLLGFLLLQVKEITTLLAASYGIALLLDPFVTGLERRRVPRSLSIIALILFLFALLFLLVLIAVPIIVDQYRDLILFLPEYLKAAGEKAAAMLQAWLHVKVPADLTDVTEQAKKYVSAFGTEHLQDLSRTVGDALLQGYSFVLTVINLFLLPFFVYYLTRDLRSIHKFIGGLMPRTVRRWSEHLGQEILVHVYAFFKGQITVCVILALFYVLGFSLAGLPSAVIVGTITGLLNIVPYLGVTVGFILSSIITLVTEPTASQFLAVLLVFAVMQTLEGTILTPRIVGKSVGIHPLVMMVTLVIGGQLFGLLGLVLAVPAAAAIRVLFSHLLSALDQGKLELGDEKVVVPSPSAAQLTEPSLPA